MRRLFTMLLFLVFNLLCFAQVVINPVYDRTSFEVLHPHVDKVEFKKDSTKVFCSVKYQESWSYNIPQTMFIEDLKNHQKYQITKCIGLPFEPEERAFIDGGTFQFTFCFPQIKGLQKFNLIEDPTKNRFFNIYGIDISTSYPQTFDETEYKRFKNMSDFYKTSGDINKFAEFEEKELSAAQYIFGKRSIAASVCYIQLAHYYNEIGDYVKAIDLGEQALECDSIQLGVENKEYPVYANTLGSLSQFYLNAGKDEESLQCALKCLRIRKSIEDEQGYLNELYNILLSVHDNYGIIKRIAVVNKELESLPSFIEASSLPIARLYKIIAGKYSLLNDNAKAIEYCDKSLEIFNKHMQKTEEYAEILGKKCRFLKELGLKYEAIASGETSRQVFDSLNIKSVKYAEMLKDLAHAYSMVLDYEKSIQLQKDAVSIFKSEEDWIALAESYVDIGNCYHYSEDLDNAELYLKKAVKTLEDHDDAKQIIAKDKESIGYWNVDDPIMINSLKQYIGFVKSRYYSTLANIFMKKGRLFDAISVTKEKGKLLKEIDEESYACNLTTLSFYYLQNNQIPEAINSANQSIELLKKVSNRNNYLAISYGILVQCNFINGEKQQAKDYLMQYLSLTDVDNDIRIAFATSLSSLYINNDEYAKAENSLSEVLDNVQTIIKREIIGMTSEQKQRLWDKYEWLYLQYREVVEKSDWNEELISKLYNYILFSKSLLLDTDISDVEKLLQRMAISWKDIQKKLSNQDIVIEFFTTREDSLHLTYHAMIIDKTCKFPNMVTLYSDSRFLELKKNSTNNIMNIVGSLIWKPILSQYSNVENIYFSPDGIINRLPIEYCYVDGIGEIMNHYKLFRLSSTKEIVFQSKKTQKANAILYGGLNYETLAIESTDNDSINGNSLLRSINARGGFDPLYSALDEVQEIDRLLRNKKVSSILYTDEKGTEESFKKLSGKDVNMIHLSTHGMYIGPDIAYQKRIKNNFNFLELITNEKDPVQEDILLTHSFLVMSGGNKLIYRKAIEPQIDDDILTAFEISQLDLRKVDMVVLSACETGLGDINYNGVYGLQRGFKKAGVNSILMSLDKVDDEATKILMVEFYKNLMSGKSKHQSLKDAQKYLRQIENGKYDMPEYWASFILLDGIN